jgi:YD repeat-containing protein
MEYDGLNRIWKVSYLKPNGAEEQAEGTPKVTYTYDEEHTNYFNKGRLTKVSTESVGTVPQTIQAYDYDKMGRVVSQTQTIGTDPYTISYSYGLADQLLSETYPSGKQVKYSYDQAMRLSSVKNGTNQLYSSGYQYYAHGGLKAETLGNGAVQSFEFNDRKRYLRTV